MILNENELGEFIKDIKNNNNLKEKASKLIIDCLDLRDNPFHPLVFINGNPQIGKDVFIGFYSEINAKNGNVVIGNNCDIASFVSINVADSHKKCIGLSKEIQRGNIVLEDNVFVGSHSFIGGNVYIGHHSVVAAGTILINEEYIPPYSLIKGNPAKIQKEYYLNMKKNLFDDL